VNKKEVSKFLGVSVRRVEQFDHDERLGAKTYVKGKTGKEAHWEEEAVERLKVELNSTDKPDTGLQTLRSHDARLFAVSLVEAMQNHNEPKQKAGRDVEIADKPLLKLDEAAALTGLSRQILRKAIDSEELKGKIIGRAYRIKRDDLDVFVKNL
jgi:excisionase family DNA binding protein